MTCGQCDGAGWVTVGPDYVAQRCPEPGLPEGDTPGLDVLRADLVAAWEQRRASVAREVYPCKVCNEAAFFRWAGRHWLADHDRAACNECSTPGSGARRRGRTPEPSGRSPVDLPARKDLE